MGLHSDLPVQPMKGHSDLSHPFPMTYETLGKSQDSLFGPIPLGLRAPEACHWTKGADN